MDTKQLNNDQKKRFNSPEDTDVREPIPIREETLITQPVYNPRKRKHAHEPFRHYKAEKKGPLWKNPTLATLFSPPLEIICNKPFEEACIFATDNKKWIIINVQTTTEFESHMLNRDTWSDVELKELIKNNYIFCQFDKESANGKWVGVTYHPPRLPLIALLDPISKLKIKSWCGFNKPKIIYDYLKEFNENHEFGTEVIPETMVHLKNKI